VSYGVCIYPKISAQGGRVKPCDNQDQTVSDIVKLYMNIRL